LSTDYPIHIEQACHGLDALALLTAGQHKIDLIFTDILMPKMDGMGLVYALYQAGLIGQIPVIGMSSLSPMELVAIQTGLADVSWFDGWLAKPFAHDMVKELTQEYCK
jgi:CheY-like chemotaxis protein